jgi:nitroreductase
VGYRRGILWLSPDELSEMIDAILGSLASTAGRQPAPGHSPADRSRCANEHGDRRVEIVMQTWDAITSRRNVRTFADRPVAAADLDQILEAGRRSPSSQNWQPWDFILVTQREQLRELATVWRGAGHVAQSAATIVVVGPPADNEFHRAQFDLGQATMAMTLAAAGLGIGSCHAGVADIQLARQLLGFPADRDWAFLVSLGYPADRPLTPIKTPRRRPFDEVVHRDHWA